MRARSRGLAAAEVDRQRRFELGVGLDGEQRVSRVGEVEMPYEVVATEPLRAIDEHLALLQPRRRRQAVPGAVVRTGPGAVRTSRT